MRAGARRASRAAPSPRFSRSTGFRENEVEEGASGPMHGSTLQSYSNVTQRAALTAAPAGWRGPRDAYPARARAQSAQAWRYGARANGAEQQHVATGPRHVDHRDADLHAERERHRGPRDGALQRVRRQAPAACRRRQRGRGSTRRSGRRRARQLRRSPGCRRPRGRARHPIRHAHAAPERQDGARVSNRLADDVSPAPHGARTSHRLEAAGDRPARAAAATATPAAASSNASESGRAGAPGYTGPQGAHEEPRSARPRRDSRDDAASVGTVDPGPRRAISTLSSPRAGVNAFIATPAAYAPPTESAETRRPGYAATSTPRQASARNTSVRSWRTSAGRRNRPSRWPNRSEADSRASPSVPRMFRRVPPRAAR
jgi:hypothetical protein